MTLEGFVTWVIVGLLTGYLAGIVVKGGRRGLIADASLGLGGSLMGGSVFQFLAGSP